MRAVGYFAPGPITAPNSLMDIELPRPGRDLLVEVRAVSVNPVDYKVRASAAPPTGTAKVIGYDAAGAVVEAGPQASLFRRGDEVFYAGSIIRSGTNAEFHLVDERIVGHKPRSLGFAEAAALPLTSITAWEALFDRMDIRKPVLGAAPSVLIIGGAGGVSSIAIQLVPRSLISLWWRPPRALRRGAGSRISALITSSTMARRLPSRSRRWASARPDSCSPPLTRPITSRRSLS
jgi:NADPH:quinone reductase